MNKALWYFDADTIGPAKVLQTVRPVTWPGDTGERPGSQRKWQAASPVAPTDVPDRLWIRTVTVEGLLIVTRDKKIRSRLSEVEAVRASGAQMFALEPEGVGTTWELLETLVPNMRDMEAFARATPGPFIAVVTRTGGVRDLRIFDPK